MAKRSLASPDNVICCDCETPCYVFEWGDGVVTEAVCEVCGNEEEGLFLSEEEYEAYAHSDAWTYEGR